MVQMLRCIGQGRKVTNIRLFEELFSPALGLFQDTLLFTRWLLDTEQRRWKNTLNKRNDMVPIQDTQVRFF